MNKYKKLLDNSLIFIIGNFGSKIISLVMVPLYTYVLTTSQYGTVDLLTTTISLLVPILSLSIDEAVLRFTMLDNVKSGQRKSIFTTALVLNIVSQLLFVLMIYPLLSYLKAFGDLLLPFIILLFLSQIQTTLSQFARGIGKIKSFAFNGILMTVVTAGLNILLLVVYKFGLTGYVVSLIIANLVSVVYLFLVVNGIRNFELTSLNTKVLKQLTAYSIPLIPNMVIWWVITGSTRYFILMFLGASVNGLFAVANKIPSILSIFTTVFQQAWQLSAFEEFSSKKSGKFFSKVFEYYFQFLFIGCSLIYILLRTVVPHLVGVGFMKSWMIMPILLMAVVYQSFSSFIGTNYTASMKTKGVFISSIIGGIVSVVCNLVFIPTLGVLGTGIGTLISFLVTFFYRYYDTNKFFEFAINKTLFLLNNVLLLVQALFLYVLQSQIGLWTSQIVCFLLMMLLNRKFINTLFHLFKTNILNRNLSRFKR